MEAEPWHEHHGNKDTHVEELSVPLRQCLMQHSFRDEMLVGCVVCCRALSVVGCRRSGCECRCHWSPPAVRLDRGGGTWAVSGWAKLSAVVGSAQMLVLLPSVSAFFEAPTWMLQETTVRCIPASHGHGSAVSVWTLSAVAVGL